MNADEARQQTIQQEQEYINSWWNEIKRELFNIIKYQVEQRRYKTTICKESEVGFDTDFLNEEVKVNKLIKELKELGYDVEYTNGESDSEFFKYHIDISWK
jgi:hypothetical protein